MADFENIELDLKESEAKFAKSDFAQVIFNDVKEYYNSKTDLECHYTITPGLTPNTRDWVGLFKVGWSSARDYVYFDWVRIPSSYSPGKEVLLTIIFPASVLKEDGDFYQFCYVTSSGQVRGASTPFQFRTTAPVDYVAIEDDDDDLMIIKSKTSALEDELQKAYEETEKLKRRISTVEKERDRLITNLINMETALKQEVLKKNEANSKYQESLEKSTKQAEDITELIEKHAQLKDQLKRLTEEKEEIERVAKDNDVNIKSLEDKIKSLVNEKDSLNGKVRLLQEEKEMYQEHFMSSDSKVQGYIMEIDSLSKQLAHEEKNKTQTSERINTLEKDLDNERTKLARQLTIAKTDQIHIEDLSSTLQNMQDKLDAAEQSKHVVCEQLQATEQVCEKVSRDVEDSKSEAYIYQQELEKVKDDRKKEGESFEYEKKILQTTILEKTKEIKMLEDKITSVQKTAEETTGKESESSNALKVSLRALEDMKSRCTRLTSERDTLKHKVEVLSKSGFNFRGPHEQQVKDLSREIEDMKERLSMGEEQYKIQVIENLKLQQQLKAKRKTGTKRSASTSTIEEQTTKCDAASATESLEASSDHLSSGEIERQWENLSQELEKRGKKKDEYKRKYKEEKEKVKFLTSHMEEEYGQKAETLRLKEEEIRQQREKIRSRDEEIDMLQTVITNTNEQYEKQIKSLKQEMAELQRSNAEYREKLEFLGQNSMQEPNHSEITHSIHEAPYPGSEPLPLRFPSTSRPREATPTAPVPEPITEQPARCKSPQTVARPPLTQSELEELMKDIDPEPPKLASPQHVACEASLGLPPPLEPERLPAARVAAVQACEKNTHVVGGRPQPVERSEPEDPTEDEKYEDAPEEPYKVCPVCEMTFPPTTPDTRVDEHIKGHYNLDCPVCGVTFDRALTEANIAQHVNQHFDN